MKKKNKYRREKKSQNRAKLQPLLAPPLSPLPPISYGNSGSMTKMSYIEKKRKRDFISDC